MVFHYSKRQEVLARTDLGGVLMTALSFKWHQISDSVLVASVPVDTIKSSLTSPLSITKVAGLPSQKIINDVPQAFHPQKQFIFFSALLKKISLKKFVVQSQLTFFDPNLSKLYFS